MNSTYCSSHMRKRNDREDIARMRAMRDRVRAAGITWAPLAYHKSPSGPATAYDIAVGTLVALWLTLRHRVQLVHARSYVPALIGLLIKRLTGAHLLFDMRGFWADERIDGGLWPESGSPISRHEGAGTPVPALS